MKYFVLLFFSGCLAFAQPQVPELNQWATDQTATLSPDQINSLNFRLKTYEDSTSNQLVVLMIVTLEGYPIEYYSYDVAKKNKIGTEKRDNGVLFLIAKKDRKMRIEVGYGLEGVLTDAHSSSIIRNVVAPHFRKEEYFAGITAGINAIIAAIGGEYKIVKEDKKGNAGSTIFTILFILVMIFLFFFRGKGGGRRGGPIIFTPGGFGGFSGKSGGFGGFGGFGGGGGSFGGGGASGGW
ncbi:MAG: TPM domain-containing protein [Ignavibacteriaceae bacterium]|nr:TPM domain-containing protein [Ignavibacteriaceae bacterium]